MLLTKFQGNQSSGSGDYIFGHHGQFGHVTWTKCINFLKAAYKI